MKEPFIYIVLIKAQTGLGSFARKLWKYEYTHMAVCLEDALEEFITFSRKKRYSPFDAGFMRETRECYAFGKQKEFKVKVFRLPVPPCNLGRITSFISETQNDGDYIFNLYAMALRGLRIYKAYNCMSFSGKIIELSGSVRLTRKYDEYTIKDFDGLLGEYLFFEGNLLRQYTAGAEYMRKSGLMHNLRLFFRLGGKLLYRALFKRAVGE